MTKAECIALLTRYADYDGMGIPKLAGCKEAMKKAVELLSEQPSEDLEVAAEEYADGPECSWAGTSAIECAFKAGAKWQAEKCDEETSKLLYAERQTAYINGWDDHKEQMMKEAVDGTIFCKNLNRFIFVPQLDESLTYGDKVKLIIVKED